MSSSERKRNRKQRDVTGWVLGATIVVLATADLIVWAALWNVPNPISRLLTAERAHASSAQTPPPPPEFRH